MFETGFSSINLGKVLCVILGGGKGARLFPLTRDRAEPAVPLAAKYRLVDILISNCIHSHFRRIYILTQFNSASLNRHISCTYDFDRYSAGFVDILAAQQTTGDTSWYGGTADAVRKHLGLFMRHVFDYLLVLSGDQLYQMDFQKVVEQHQASGADITIAATLVGRSEAGSMGVMQIDENRRITRFVEKPVDAAEFDLLKLTPDANKQLSVASNRELFLGSMGIYVFNRRSLLDLLDNDLSDFGSQIFPNAIATHRVSCFVYDGYWEDISTIRAFYNANLSLLSDLPRLNLYDMTTPIFTRSRYLPGAKINGAQVDHSLISEGCIINRAHISHSVIGPRSIVGEGTELRRVVSFGKDFYETRESVERHERAGLPRAGIGAHCRIKNAIIDKNTRIGNNVTISPSGKPPNMDHECYYIRDGIVIIPKDAIIPHGMVI